MGLKVGFDVGNGHLKIATGVDAFTSMPATVAYDIGAAILDENRISARKPVRISFDGAHYFVGDRAHAYGRAVNMVSGDRLADLTGDMRALFYAGLSRVVPIAGDEPIELGIGLPLETLGQTQESADRARAAVKKWAGGRHTWTADGKEMTATISRVIAPSQADATLHSWMRDDHGKLIAGRVPTRDGESFVVVNIGFGTTEVQSWEWNEEARKFMPVYGMSRSLPNGVAHLFERLPGGDVRPTYVLDEQLIRGMIDDANVVMPWAREVARDVFRLGNGIRQMNQHRAVVLAGGGAIHARDAFARLLNLSIVDQPQFAVARGLLLLLGGKK